MTRRRGAASNTSGSQLSAAEKLAGAVQMRRGGATMQQIVDAGYYSHTASVCRALTKYYKHLHSQIAEDVEAIRAMELDRIDNLIRSLWIDATDRNSDSQLYSVDRVVKLMQHRAKLLGIEAPQRHELTGEAGERLMPEGIDLSNLAPEQLEQINSILESAAHGSG